MNFDIVKIVDWVLNQNPAAIIIFFVLTFLYPFLKSVNIYDLITHYFPKKHFKMDHDLELLKKSRSMFEVNESKIMEEHIRDNIFELITGFMPSKKIYSRFIEIHPTLRKSGISKKRIKTVLRYTQLKEDTLTIHRDRTYYLEYYGQLIYMVFVGLVLLLLTVYIFYVDEKREYGLLLVTTLLFPLIQISSIMSKEKMLDKVSIIYDDQN